jgi:hypothetical protein
VYEYIEKFNYLAKYGTHHVDTDDKNVELFRKELSLPLQITYFGFVMCHSMLS